MFLAAPWRMPFFEFSPPLTMTTAGLGMVVVEAME